MFKWIARLFSKNDKCDNAYIGVPSLTSSVDVKGFLRDYKLLSRIKPEHFISGGNVGTQLVFANSPVSEDNSSTSGFVINPMVNTENGPVRVDGRYLRSGDKTQDPNIPDTTFLANPKQVFDELETIPCPANMENLDNKKYQEFFSKFKNTSDELINKLLDVHTHLKIGPADDFIPEFPIDAHTTMLEYSDMVSNMCNKLPCFYIIAKANEFKTKEGERRKRDPILLVQSPIGMYWQILGAWDEEMELVNDL